MTTEHNRDDETPVDLPAPAVTDAEAETVKGGATDSKPGAAVSPAPIVGIRIPKLIDPCW